LQLVGLFTFALPLVTHLLNNPQIVMHQAPPTAKGIHFVTLEDETGLINLVIKPDIYQRVQRIVRGHSLLWVQGQVQRRDAVVSVLVQAIKPLELKQTPRRG
jgi:error-prone DNA polymerase